MKAYGFSLRMSYIAGIASIILYSASVFVSWSLYPGPFSPFTNWISDLGNSGYNPRGAIFFNVGLILSGIALFLFCPGLRKWYTNDKSRRIGFVLVQILGFTLAFSMIMAGIFSEDYIAQHLFWSYCVFVSMGFLLFLSAGFLLTYPPRTPAMRLVACYGLGTGVIDFVFGFVLNIHLLEWVNVFASMGYLALVAYIMSRKEPGS